MGKIERRFLSEEAQLDLLDAKLRKDVRKQQERLNKAKPKRKLNPAALALAAAKAAGLAKERYKRDPSKSPFTFPEFPPSVQKPAKAHGMAFDDVFGDTNGNDWSWMNASFLRAVSSVFEEGLVFPGYTYLAELAQRGEYRVIAETIAEEATRKWIKFTSKDDGKSDDQKEVVENPNKPPLKAGLDAVFKSAPDEKGDDKTQRIKELTDAFDKLQVRKHYQKVSEVDSLFGRAHLYIDIRNGDDPNPNTTIANREELLTSIGNGRDDISKSKIGRGSVKRLKVVEPVWTYPTTYDAQDPLSEAWYEPEMWYVMGKQVHKTRLMKFVSKEVPDILKPAYAFGGLSTSQIAKPYVDNWLKIRQSVADIVQAFSIFVLGTDLSEVLTESGEELFQRIDLFNNLRNNKGLMVINKDAEEFQNVAAPLGTLDSIQAQSQEHMAAISRIPLVKLLGIQPAGLNASSEGELRTFYDHIHAYQERFFRPSLTILADMVMLSLWGEVDETITFEFVPLWELDAAALATKQKTEADTDVELINAGIISPQESRERIANDPESPYQGLDINDMPEPPQPEGMEGMEDGGQEEGTEPPGGTPGGGMEGPGLGGIGGQRGGNGGAGAGGNQLPAHGGGVKGGGGTEGQDDVEEGGPSIQGPENGGMEDDRVEKPSAISKSERNLLTAAAALVRQKRRAKKSEPENLETGNGSEEAELGSLAGDERPILLRWAIADLVTKPFLVQRFAADEMLARDKTWTESDHPRDADGKFTSYGAAPGLAKKAKALGFVKMAEGTSSGKIKLTHADGSVLIIEPPGAKDPSFGKGQSQSYSFYPADGGKPIQGTTGQSGKSFAEKVGAYLEKAKETQTEPKTTSAEELAAMKDFLAKEGYPAAFMSESEIESSAKAKGFGKTSEPPLETAGKKINQNEAVDYLEGSYDDLKQIAGTKEFIAYKMENGPGGVEAKIKVNADGSWVVSTYGGANTEQGDTLDGLKKALGDTGGEKPPGNTVSEIKQQYEDGLITHEEMIVKLKEIAGAKPNQSAGDFITEQTQTIVDNQKSQDYETQQQWKESEQSFKESPTAMEMVDFMAQQKLEPLAKTMFVQVFKGPNGEHIRIGKNGNFFAINQDGSTKGKGQGIVELENYIFDSNKSIVGKIGAALKNAFSGGQKTKQTPEQLAEAAKQTTMKNKMYSSLHDKGYGHSGNTELEKQGIIEFKNTNGQGTIKVANNGDWLAESPGFSAKVGSGQENLEAFLNKEKAFNQKWKNGDPTSWTDEHDTSPDKQAKQEAKKKAEEEKAAAAKAEALEKQNQAALKAMKAEEDKKVTEAKLAAMQAEHAKQSKESQSLLNSWALTQPAPSAKATSAIKSYTGSGYNHMNDSLRHGDIELGKSGPNKAMYDWINSCSFPSDMTLYRTVKSDFAKMMMAAIPEGGMFHDKGFSSITADPNFLWGYSKGNKDSIRLQIKVKKGQKIGVVSGMSSSGTHEAEVIANAGTTYRVIKQHGNYWEVEMLDENYWDNK